MVKIVITQDLGFRQKDIEELKNFGDVVAYDGLSKNYDEWLDKCKGADIILTGKFGLKNRYQDLHNCFLALPFVGVGFFDREILKNNNITVSYCPGCNRDAVSEWIVGMMVNLLRQFPMYINNVDLHLGEVPKKTKSLTGKTIAILGKGNIGSRVGKICDAFDMQVTFFKRGDNLKERTKNVDIVVNCLRFNEATNNILDKSFFMNLKKGSYFITVTGNKIYDIEAIFEALDKGILAGVADDLGGIQVGDVSDPFYKRLQEHPKILATPHIAYNADVTNELSKKMIIENIRAWLNGNPTNILE